MFPTYEQPVNSSVEFRVLGMRFRAQGFGLEGSGR